MKWTLSLLVAFHLVNEIININGESDLSELTSKSLDMTLNSSKLDKLNENATYLNTSSQISKIAVLKSINVTIEEIPGMLNQTYNNNILTDLIIYYHILLS